MCVCVYLFIFDLIRWIISPNYFCVYKTHISNMSGTLLNYLRCPSKTIGYCCMGNVLAYLYPYWGARCNSVVRTHTTAFVTPVVEHWLEREIAQWVHPMKDRSDVPSHHERTLLLRSYISIPKQIN